MRSFDVFFNLRLNKQLSKNRDDGDLRVRRHRAHYNVIMILKGSQECFRRMASHCGIGKSSRIKEPSSQPQRLLTTWWRHQMETFSAVLALCAGNSPVPGEFPAQRPVTRSFYVSFDLCPNKWLSKQWWDWWFETLSCPSWQHCNDSVTRDVVGNSDVLGNVHYADLTPHVNTCMWNLVLVHLDVIHATDI